MRNNLQHTLDRSVLAAIIFASITVVSMNSAANTAEPPILGNTESVIDASAASNIQSIDTTLVGDEAASRIGLEIAKERYKRFKGYGDYQVDITMTLENKRGNQSTYKLRSKALEVADDGDKSVIIFDYPTDQKGVILLGHTHRVGPDDQMLYLPSIKRIKRIAANNKSGPFMGSEFAYEDLGSKEVEKASYRFLREEELNGVPCYVTERIPTSPYSGYTRLEVWTDKSEFRILRADYYDRKNSLLKTLEYQDFQYYDGRFWRASNALMTNHQTQKTTLMSFDNYRFTTGLSDKDFNRNAIKRIR